MTMNDIAKNQSSESNIKIAAAFRYAYRKAKFWKSMIWTLTLILVIGQLFAAINHQSFQEYLPDNLAAMLITISLATMLMTTLGKHYLINTSVVLGSKLQRLHDFNILSLGIKPSHLDVLPSQIEKFSSKWLSSKPDDKVNLSEWWPVSVSNIPDKAGIALCLLSTFKWEYELRSKYSWFLVLSTLAILAGSFCLMHILDLLLADFIVKIIVPLSPLLGLLIDEWLLNRTGVQLSRSSSQEALNIWNDLSGKTITEQMASERLGQLMYSWDNYRAAMSPIFDWIYWLTQKTMNDDMVIDIDSLVYDYQQNQ